MGSGSVELSPPGSPAMDTQAVGGCKAFSGKYRWQTEGVRLWVGEEKVVSPFPGHGHTSFPIEAAPAATLRKPNLFNFYPVISNCPWFNPNVQPHFAKAPLAYSISPTELAIPAVDSFLTFHNSCA